MSEEKYLRETWEYNNDYDRETIRLVKELDRLAVVEKEKLERGESPDDEALKAAITECERVHRERFEEKQSAIESLREAHHVLDRLVASTPVPKKIRCLICGREMTYEAHTFKNNDRDILFFFACPERHLPKRLVYANGTDYPYKPVKHRCPKCQGKLVTSEEVQPHRLLLTDTCSRCGYTDVLELEDEPPAPIDETERERYCLTPPNPAKDPLRTFKDVMSFLNILDGILNKKEGAAVEAGDDLPEPVKLKKLDLPALESRVTALLEKAGFTKVQFDKPAFGDAVRVGLSAFDTLKRPEAQKLKVFRMALNEDLLGTNWRLERQSANVRMGCLNAVLLGYDREADLKKLTYEVQKKTLKKVVKKKHRR